MRKRLVLVVEMDMVACDERGRPVEFVMPTPERIEWAINQLNGVRNARVDVIEDQAVPHG